MPDPSPASGDFVDAYDRNTGQKLPHPVPRHWINAPYAQHLAMTPTAKAREAAQIQDDPDKAAAVHTPDPAPAGEDTTSTPADSPATTTQEA